MRERRPRKHAWQRGRFTGAVTCSHCGLLPLDRDDYQSPCDGQKPARFDPPSDLDHLTGDHDA